MPRLRAVVLPVLLALAGVLLAPPAPASAAGGTLSGRVTAGLLQPLANVCVRFEGGLFYVDPVVTGLDGSWTATVPAGTYTLQFDPHCRQRQRYLPEWYDDAPSRTLATPIPVEEGSRRTGLNAVLSPAGAISGQVADAAGRPLAGLCVRPVDKPYPSGVTDSSGRYVLEGLAPGAYVVRFEHCGVYGTQSTHVPEYYDDVDRASEATPVAVSAGAATSGVDAQLAAYGSISGVVRDGVTGATVADVCVRGSTFDGRYSVPYVRTGTDGRYRLEKVAPHLRWRVEFGGGGSCAPAEYAPQYWQDTYDINAATPVAVADGAAVSGIDGALRRGGIISGRVTDMSGNGVQTTVRVQGPGGGEVATDAEGRYRFEGLGKGRTWVVAVATSTLPETYHPSGDSLWNGTSVEVELGQHLQGVDIRMPRGALLSGRLTRADGRPAAGMLVALKPRMWVGSASPSVRTGSDGSWALPPVFPGRHHIWFAGDSADAPNAYYLNGRDEGTATEVQVVEGQVVPGLDQVLLPSAVLAGRVTDEAGSPVVGACVRVQDRLRPSFVDTYGTGETSSDGSWVVHRLGPGSYVVRVVPCKAAGVEHTWYPGVATPEQATQVVLATGERRDGLDMVVGRSGTITGTITGSGTIPVRAQVELTSSAGDVVSVSPTPEGRYIASGLTPGEWTVRFIGCAMGSGHVTEYYPDASDRSGAAPVSVRAGATTSGIDAVLSTRDERPDVCRRPTTPTGVAATVDGTVATVRWAPVDDGGTELYGYAITTVPATRVLNFYGRQTEVLYTGLTPGTSYCFLVLAESREGRTANGSSCTSGGSSDGGSAPPPSDGGSAPSPSDGGSEPPASGGGSPPPPTEEPSPEPSPEPTLTPAPDEPAQPVRLAGADRITTAIAVSRDAHPTAGSAGIAVLARADSYADALAGAPLAASRNGPLLLTTGDRLDGRVLDEIRRVVPAGGTVVLLGGTSALSGSVAEAVVRAGYAVQRYAGATRYDTAVMVAERGLGSVSILLLASGAGFADALAGSAVAGPNDAAVLLTAGDHMHPSTAAYLSRHPGVRRYALGGPAAKAAPGATPLVGRDRYETAVAVARALAPDPTGIGVTTGLNFPDALAAGPHLGRRGAPLLLTPATGLPTVVRGYLAEQQGQLTQAWIYGGTTPVPARVAAELAAAMTP